MAFVDPDEVITAPTRRVFVDPDASQPATTATAPQKPSVGQQFLSGAQTGFKYGGLPGAMLGVVPAASRALDEVAYEAGGKVTDVATGMGLPPKGAAAAGYATNVGLQLIPALAGGGIGKTVAPAFEAGAAKWMQSSLKPVLPALESGQAGRAIQTMLDEGINVSKGGLMKLRQKINELNTEITEAVKNSTASIDKAKVAGTLHDAIKKFEMQVTPKSDVAAIERAWKEFVEHPMLVGKADIPVPLAQSMKQGTYKALGDKAYGELKGAEMEAQKTLARGLKEGIANAVPGIAQLNKREGDLINALNVNERRVLMEANKNPMGLSLLAHDPIAWAAFMADRSGIFKSIVARMLYSGSERIPQAATGIGIAAARSLPNTPTGGILSSLQAP